MIWSVLVSVQSRYKAFAANPGRNIVVGLPTEL